MQEAMLCAGLSAVRDDVTRSENAGCNEDRSTAAACAAGDPLVFERLYRQHGHRMKSIAFHHLGNQADAEDAVQEAFLKIHRAAATYGGQASFATWAYTILIHTCYDLLRKRKRRGPESSIDEYPGMTSYPASNVDDVKKLTLRALLAALPQQWQTVFTLFAIEGLTHAEISSILEISEGNSKWILFSTKKRLREQWKATP